MFLEGGTSQDQRVLPSRGNAAGGYKQRSVRQVPEKEICDQALPCLSSLFSLSR